MTGNECLRILRENKGEVCVTMLLTNDTAYVRVVRSDIYAWLRGFGDQECGAGVRISGGSIYLDPEYV